MPRGGVGGVGGAGRQQTLLAGPRHHRAHLRAGRAPVLCVTLAGKLTLSLCGCGVANLTRTSSE